MLDALFSALPDQAFFDRKDIGTQVRDSLLAAEEPYGCHLRGAKVWNLAKHPEYPLYLVCKTNTVDNTEFIPLRDATLLIFSRETGQLIATPAVEDNGKMPLAAPKPHKPARPDLPRAKTYAVRDAWRVLRSEDFRKGSGSYRAYLHAGNFQSEPFDFRIEPAHGQPRPDFEIALSGKEIPQADGQAIPHALFDPIPGLEPPAADGLSLRFGKLGAKDGSVSMQVSGAFRFTGSWHRDWERMPLHVLVAVPGGQALDANVLWLPRSHVRFAEDSYTGCFSFDLAELFIASPGEKPKLPGSAWISLAHRGWLGPISRIDIPGH